MVFCTEAMLSPTKRNQQSMLDENPQVSRGTNGSGNSDTYQSTIDRRQNSDDNTEDLRIFSMEGINVLYLKPVALMVGKIGLASTGYFMMMEPLIRFSVLSNHGGKGAAKMSACVIASHILKIAYTAGTCGKNYLAFALDDSARENLPTELRLYGPKKYWDLVFYFVIDRSFESDFLSKLNSFFGSKVRHVVPSEWSGMPALVNGIVFVMRYARFLEKKQAALNKAQNAKLESQRQSGEDHGSPKTGFEGFSDNLPELPLEVEKSVLLQCGNAAKISGIPVERTVIARDDLPVLKAAADFSTLALNKRKELVDICETSQCFVPDAQTTSQEMVTSEDDKMSECDAIDFGDDVHVSVYQLRHSLRHNAYMYGEVANLCLLHYIPKVILSNDWSKRNNMCFLDSNVYEFIHIRCKSRSLKYEKLPGNVAESFKYKRRFSSMPSFFQHFRDFEVSIMPVFWRNHWLLGIIQWRSCDENAVMARLIMMDSKFNDPRNKEILACIANTVHSDMGVALTAAFMASGTRRLKQLKLIRCDSLPCQENDSDCGWFMVLYAEFFTKNMEWMEMSDDEICHMRLSDENVELFRQRLRCIKREVGSYVERYVNRSLFFKYD